MSTPETLARSVLPALLDMTGPRTLVAVAGPPGAGKSTVSKALHDALQAAGRSAAVVPMDGFHLDNRLLAERGLLARKGAPQSFDADGFVALVRRAAQGGDLIYPLFDRDRDISVAGAAFLPSQTEFVIFEGNYLLLNDAPWKDLRNLWTLSVFVDTPRGELERRLLHRWLQAGLPQEQAQARRDANDLPNADLVLSDSFRPDLIISN